MTRARRHVESWLSHPRLPWHLAALTTLLLLPSLWVGWQLDDHFHRMVMTGAGGGDVRPAEAFSVLQGNPEENRRFMELGWLPWWTADTFRLAFLRPLSVLTHRLDYRLWPDSAALMHAHSLLWHAALVVAAVALFRRITGTGWIAGLAALLYAVDEAHAVPAAWLANRNAVVATVFGVLCLVAHDRWRREGSRWGAVGSPVCLGLALLAGEAALGAVGYLVAYAVFLDEDAPLARARSLLPSGVVLALWALLYRLGGFGARGSGLYVEPLSDPAGFARAVLERGPLLLMGLGTPVPAGLGVFPFGKLGGVLWWGALGFVLLAGVALFSLVRRDRVSRFWCLGMALALVPACATFPANRLLLFAGVGAMGLLARFLAGAFPSAEGGGPSVPGGALVRGMAVFWALAHLLLAPLAMPGLALEVRRTGERMLAGIRSVPSDPSIAGQVLVLANAPDYLLYVTNISVVKTLEGQPVPRRIRALSSGPVAVEIAREDDTTLRVLVEEGLLSGPLGGLFRDPKHAPALGSEVRLGDVSARVTALTPDGRPREIVYRFSVPLEDPSLRWLRWEGGGYVDFEPPPPGGRVVLEAPPPGPFASFGNGPGSGT